MKNGVMRMLSVMESYCFCSKASSRLKSGARFKRGGGVEEVLLYRYVLLKTRS